MALSIFAARPKLNLPELFTILSGKGTESHMYNLSFIDSVIIAVYLGLMLVIGFMGMRKRGNLEEYYVGGRKSGSFTIGCLWMSSWVGGATVVGAVDKAYNMGISSAWYCLVMALGCVIFALTSASLIQRIGSKLSCITYPELIENCYGAGARALTTVTTLIAYIAYTAGQFAAMAMIIQGAFDVERSTAVWLSAAVIAAYTALGGFFALSLTSILQAMTILFTFVLLMAPFLWFKVGGLAPIVDSLPASYFDISAWGWPTMIGMAVTITFTFFTSMDSYTRCFAAKSSRSSRRGAMLAACMVAAIAIAGCYSGLAARMMIPEVSATESAIGMLIFSYIPAGMKGLILVGVLAAIMSTGSVCLLTASANITRDLYQRYARPEASSRSLVLLGSMAVLVVAVLSTYLAISKQSVIDILYIAFTINSAGLFIPTIAAFVWNKGNSRTAFASIGLTLITVLIWYAGKAIAPEVLAFKLDPVWPGLAVSAITFFTGALLFPASDDEVARRKALFISANS